MCTVLACGVPVSALIRNQISNVCTLFQCTALYCTGLTGSFVRLIEEEGGQFVVDSDRRALKRCRIEVIAGGKCGLGAAAAAVQCCTTDGMKPLRNRHTENGKHKRTTSYLKYERKRSEAPKLESKTSDSPSASPLMRSRALGELIGAERGVTPETAAGGCRRPMSTV